MRSDLEVREKKNALYALSFNTSSMIFVLLKVPDRTPTLPSGEAIQNSFVNVSSAEEDITTDNQNELTNEMEEHRLEDNDDMDTSDPQPIFDEQEVLIVLLT